MTRTEFMNLYAKLDKKKFDLFQKNGIAFELVVRDVKHAEFFQTGIGSGSDMSQLSLFALLSLFETAAQEGASIEDYAESVKKSVIEAYHGDFFHVMAAGGEVEG